MDRFTINDIENLCGIKAHTLRMWEKRYSLLTPKRNEGRHRQYNNEELKFMLRVAYLYHKGDKISKIAAMPKEELKKRTSTVKGEVEIQLLSVNRLLEAAIDFDEEAFDETLMNAIDKIGLEQCMLKIVYPYFVKVGMLWMNEYTLPAQEHFSSNMIRSKLIAGINALSKKLYGDDQIILLFSPEGEYHEIPLLFAHYLLKKNNKPVVYFGASVSLPALQLYCKAKKVDILYFHLITNFTKQTIDEYVNLLCKTFHDQLIVMSGPVALQVTVTATNLKLLASQEEQMNFLKNHVK